ncbi:MAG: phosphopantetheine-binding protein, partial [Hyalangium sp.]|uniref:phosphopantetheine-binding protein n=1 Tax=Hyalangium sp. TaxID=2028555 RepID=UPI003899F5E6
GLRIELGEIESTLEKHPTVQQAVVLAREDVPGDKRLVAYVRAQAGGEPEPAALREYLKQRLPTYMVPASFVVLAHFPMLASGKVDRKRLPAPTPARQVAASVELPRTELERRIVSIWQELLNVERVGVHDSFFDLGGHSLLLLKVHARLSAEVGVDVPLLELFRHSTPAALARLLGGGLPGSAGTAAPARLSPGEDTKARRDAVARMSRLRGAKNDSGAR